MQFKLDLLRSLPLLRGIEDTDLQAFSTIFVRETLDPGTVLFTAGDRAQYFYILISGEVMICEEELLRCRIKPPSIIGELGALGGLTRNTTGTVSESSDMMRGSGEDLRDFLDAHPQASRAFYVNFTRLIADKVRRDQIRLEDMRSNIIRTQKAMKQMRDFILESEDTSISEPLHDQLQELITHNRRVNYRIEPPEVFTAHIRLDKGKIAPISQISRTHVSFQRVGTECPKTGSLWSGVLLLAGPEIPISGKVLRTIGDRVDIELDLLIDEYGAALDGYLTQVQMLDYMV